MERYSILVIDDNTLFLSTTLQFFRRFERDHDVQFVLHGARTWAEAREVLEQHSFDAVLVDFYLDTSRGTDHIPTLKHTYKVQTIVAMSGRAAFEEGAQAIIAGATACVAKIDIQDIVSLTYQHLRTPRIKANELTQREIEVAKLLTQGLSNKTIAKIMCVSVNTVHSHLRNLYSKLKITSREDLIQMAQDLFG